MPRYDTHSGGGRVYMYIEQDKIFCVCTRVGANGECWGKKAHNKRPMISFTSTFYVHHAERNYTNPHADEHASCSQSIQGSPDCNSDT